MNVGFSNLNSTICHQQYDTAMLVNGLSTNMMNGFHGVDNSVCTLGYQNAQLINGVNTNLMQGQNALQTQISGCCCDLRAGQAQTQNAIERGFCQTNYNDATNTNAIIQNAHNDTDRILARLDAIESSRKDMKIAEQAAEINAYKQNTYLVNQLAPKCPVPAFLTCNPYTGQTYTNGYGYGYNNGGYGCNNGCGCG